MLFKQSRILLNNLNKKKSLMKYFTPSMFLAVLLGGQHYNTVNAVRLRQSTLAEDPVELAETEATTAVEQSFPWTATHDCTWVHRRLADKDYLTYDQQVAKQIETGTKWSDPTFPVADAIQWPDVLTGSGGNLSSYATSAYLKWLRLQTNFPAFQGFSLFGQDGAATVNDIMQGSIGNCWFMASCSAVAEFPGRLEKLFGDKDQFNNNAGFFDVNLYLLSVPITIRVDDQVPSYNSFSQTLFAKVTNKGVWMNVIEKAFAKMYGNYSALIGGAPERAVQAIIGTPGKQFTFSAMTTAQIYTVIQDAAFEDVIVAISATTAYYGLTAVHAYTVLEVYTVLLTTGTSVQLVKLRDPWGIDGGSTLSYTYRDTDTTSWNAVSASEKTRIGYSNNINDGIFFMTMDQFKIAYGSMSWNPVLDGWTRSYFMQIDDKLVNPGKNVNGGPTYTRHELVITSDISQDVIFQVNVHDSRLYPRFTGCGSGVGVNTIRTIVEWNMPGSNAQTYYFEGEYNLNGGNPYRLAANTTYRINLELYAGNT